MRKQDQKIETLKAYIRRDPGDSFSKFALALEFKKQDQPDKAIKLFESIRANDPQYVGVYYHLGKLYEARGQADRAKDIFGEGINIAWEQGEERTLSELQEAKSMLEETERG